MTHQVEGPCVSTSKTNPAYPTAPVPPGSSDTRAAVSPESPERDTFPSQHFLRQNSCLSAKQHAFLDARVLAHAHLSTDHNVVLNDNASGESACAAMITFSPIWQLWPM